MTLTKKQILAFYEGFFNQKQWELADSLIAKDYVQHNPGVEQGREGLVRAFQEKARTGEYFHLEVDRVVLDDEYAAVFLRSVNELKETKAHVVDLYRIAGNQLVEHWDYFDRRK